MKKLSPIFRHLAWIAADGIVLVHAAVVLVVFFGWAFPQLSLIYITTLAATLLSWVLRGGCVLTQWEFRLRAYARPGLAPYQDDFLIFYAAKILGKHVPQKKFVSRAGLFFLIISIGIWLVGYFG